MAGKFEIRRSTDGQYYFNLKARNGEVILTSERYTAKGNAHKGISSVMTNALLDHGLQTRPLDAIDFEARDAVAGSGWPFDLDELAPYYERAQVSCGLVGAPYEAARWGHGEAAAPIPLDRRGGNMLRCHHGPTGEAPRLVWAGRRAPGLAADPGCAGRSGSTPLPIPRRPPRVQTRESVH